MSETADTVLSAALALPAATRAELAEKLLESLDEPVQAEIDLAWAREAERRVEAYKQGTLKSVSGDDVIRSLSCPQKP